MSKKKVKKVRKNDDDKRKKRRSFLLWFFSGIAIAGGLVAGHFLYRNCHNPISPTKKYKIRVFQPDRGKLLGWEVLVNGNNSLTYADAGDKIEVIVKKNSTQIFSNEYKNLFQVEICYGEGLYLDYPLEWNEEKQYYYASFTMIESDIDINVTEKDSLDYFYYVKRPNTETGEDDNYIIDESTLGDTENNLVFYKYKNGTLSDRNEKARDQFNEKVYVGKKINNIPEHFLSMCKIFNNEIEFEEGCKITIIGKNFLSNCEAFNKELKIPSTVYLINGNFLYGCKAFNNGDAKLDLSHVTQLASDYSETDAAFLHDCEAFNVELDISSLKEIPIDFMTKCKSFDKDLTIPSTVTIVGQRFMYECENMQHTLFIECQPSAVEHPYDAYTCATSKSSALSYTQGIKIGGTYKNQWFEMFPKLEGTQFYRQLKKV